MWVTAVVGCARAYDGPSVCAANERETVINTRLSRRYPSEAFEITADNSVFVAVKSDPDAGPGSSLLKSVHALFLIVDGSDPELAPDPNFPENRISLDPEIRFEDINEYRNIDAEPGAYRLYSNASSPTIDVVRCP
ncbi:MAG: hypothetical protein R2697_22470 [Ilumatobacteraceae bacterium]